MRKPKQERFVDPVVFAHQGGKLTRELPPLEPCGGGRGPAHQARGPPSDFAHPQWLSLLNTAAYLGVSTMSVSRYANDAAYSYLDFPAPSVVVDRCYWSRDDLDAWMRSRVGAVSTRKMKRAP